MKIRHGMILAAGLGKRMQPLTNKKPKALFESKEDFNDYLKRCWEKNPTLETKIITCS